MKIRRDFRVSCLLFHVSFPRGFTLIELIVTITIIGILAGFGIAAYVKFNQTQTLRTAANDLKNNLRLAQNKALAQERPAVGCGVLDGYRVDIVNGTASYSFVPLCDGSNPLEASRVSFPSLPTGVIVSATDSQIIFRLLGSGAENSTIIVSGFGRNIDVTVTKTGEIY